MRTPGLVGQVARVAEGGVGGPVPWGCGQGRSFFRGRTAPYLGVSGDIPSRCQLLVVIQKTVLAGAAGPRGEKQRPVRHRRFDLGIPVGSGRRGPPRSKNRQPKPRAKPTNPSGLICCGKVLRKPVVSHCQPPRDPAGPPQVTLGPTAFTADKLSKPSQALCHEIFKQHGSR